MLAAEQTGDAALHQQREGAQVDDGRDDDVDDLLGKFRLQRFAAHLYVGDEQRGEDLSLIHI